MRKIDVTIIESAVSEMCIEANHRIPCDIENCILSSAKNETEVLPKSVMSDIIENIKVAKELNIPVCQDTGMAVVFVEIGQDVQLVGGDFEEAINRGVAKGYTDGLLRKSVVKDPLERVNTGDNTPAIIHTKIVPGDKIKLTVAPKGFGSENMSKMKMFNPSATREDIIEFIVDCVKKAGSNPCPPIVLGIGIGGDFEYCAYLSKKALIRSANIRNENPFYKTLEDELLKKINALNIGPQGFGGKTTALCVNIETAPTHIAGLPVAVNFGCHVTRHIDKII